MSLIGGFRTIASRDSSGRTWLRHGLRSFKSGGRREEARHGLDNQRIRFNWGYHDGASDVRHGRTLRNMAEHFDLAYGDGYRRGVKDAGEGRATDSSERAWLASRRKDDFGGWRR